MKLLRRPLFARTNRPATERVVLLRGTGATLIDAVKHFLRHAPPADGTKTMGELSQAFLQEREGSVSPAQFEHVTVKDAV